MDLKILEERPNVLLKRTELTFEVDHPTGATPPRGEVRKELAKLVHVPVERLVIERMRPRFGTAKTRGEAMAYQSPEALLRTVREHILVRNGLKEKAPKEVPPPAPAEVAPPEPPKPETPKAEPVPPPARPPEVPKAPAPKVEPPKPEAPKKEPPKAEPPKAPSAKAEGSREPRKRRTKKES